MAKRGRGAARGRGKPPAKRAARRPRSRGGKDAGAAFCHAVEAALKRGDPAAVSDEALRRVMIAAVRLYAAKAEGTDAEIPPFEKHEVTATEAVTAVCAMIRAVDLNLFDVAMWFRRPLSGAIADLERRG